MMSTMIFAMPDDIMLTQKIANESGAQLGRVQTHTFPDGESLLRVLDTVTNANIFLVARLDNPDKKLLPVLLLAEGLRQQGAASVTLIAPYLPYMRQDIAFRPGEVVSAEAFAKLISSNFDRLITIDPHLHRFRSLSDVYSIPADCLTASNSLAQWIAENAESPLVIGPDEESEQWVRTIAEQLDAPYQILRKTRSGDKDVEISAAEFEIAYNQTIVLVDDIISSGATMLQTVRSVRALDAEQPIICCATHCLATPDTLDSFVSAGVSAMAATDSVRSSISTIGISHHLSAIVTETLNKT